MATKTAKDRVSDPSPVYLQKFDPWEDRNNVNLAWDMCLAEAKMYTRHAVPISLQRVKIDGEMYWKMCLAGDFVIQLHTSDVLRKARRRLLR